MGSTVWADQQHKFHPCRQLFLSKNTLRQIDIPPRKLLSRRSSADLFLDSPRSAVDETLLQKFLPYNNCFDDDDDDADPYSSDHFRIYEFKVRRCTRSRSHDWTDCPFADGKNCKRKVCFFAHTPKQLRVLPSHYNDGYQSPVNSPIAADIKYQGCGYCHCVTASPTSTLVGMSHLSPPMSPSLSPPVSPVKSQQMGGIPPISRFGDRLGCVELNQVLSNKDALIEGRSQSELVPYCHLHL